MILDSVDLERFSEAVSTWRRAAWVGNEAASHSAYRQLLAFSRAGNPLERALAVALIEPADLPTSAGEREATDDE